MILRLQKYDLNISYKKGSQLFIADTLRAYLEKEETREDHKFCVQLEEINLVEGPTYCRRTTQSSTDPQVQEIRKFVENGCPMSRHRVPTEVVPYY